MTTVTAKQRALAGHLVANTGISIYKAMVAVGYSPKTALTPSKVTKSKGFMELLEEVMPDDELTRVHKRLLKSRKIDHMVFPLAIDDEDIKTLVESVNGVLRKIMHGETAKHAYWWVDDQKAREGALKLAYQLKGRLAGGSDTVPAAANNVYNTFITQNNLDPASPKAKELMEVTLGALMEQTKRKKIPNEPQPSTQP